MFSIDGLMSSGVDMTFTKVQRVLHTVLDLFSIHQRVTRGRKIHRFNAFIDQLSELKVPQVKRSLIIVWLVGIFNCV